MSINVLAFFAHPDDETMLCGGTLALLASLHCPVHLLIATRGEGGETGSPPLCEREQLGALRENELRCAAQALNSASLTLMDYIDPTVGPGEELYAYTGDVEKLAMQLIEAIRYRKAGALITHGINGEYGHPAHQFSYQAAKLAIHALADDAPLFYTAQANYPGHPYPRLANADAPAHLVLDITPVLAQKTAAAMCHRTQHDLFVRHHSEEAGRRLAVPEIIATEEGIHRAWPPFDGPGKISDELADLLWASGYAQLPAGI